MCAITSAFSCGAVNFRAICCFFWGCLALAIGFGEGELLAQVPQLLSYQGRVQVGTNDFEGTGQFKFALVSGDGTSTYWSNDGTAAGEPVGGVALPVTRGLYAVLLGNPALPGMQVLSPVVFTNSDVRLRVWFNDGTNGFQQFVPDQRIAAVGYAMMAAQAQTAAAVKAGAITSAMLADGAVTSGKLASGAVTAGALSSGAVTAGAIAPGAVGVTQLARKYVAGRLPASAFEGATFFGNSEVTTSYGFAFAVPPILSATLENTESRSNAPAHLVIKERTTTSFTLRMESLQPADGLIASLNLERADRTIVRSKYGAYHSLAMVGYPALSCFDGEASRVIYMRALDPYGNSWGPPTGATPPNSGGSYTSLALANGRPAIAFRQDATRQLKYVRALDDAGNSWALAEVVAENAGAFLDLVLVNGNPAIAFTDSATGALKFVRAQNADGGLWGSPVSIPGSANVGSISMKVVNSNPAIAYHAGRVLAYVRATDAAGANWPFATALDFDGPGGFEVGDYANLEVLPGSPARPAIVYLADSASCTNQLLGNEVRFLRANDANGGTWSPYQTLARGVVEVYGSALDRSRANVGLGISMALVSGTPAVIYREANYVPGLGGGEVLLSSYRYVRAKDPLGLDWGDKVGPLAEGKSGDDVKLLATSTVPGFCFGAGFDRPQYFPARDAGGTRWALESVPASYPDMITPTKLFSQVTLTNGRPCVIFYDPSNDALRAVEAADQAGRTWDAAGLKTVDGGHAVGEHNTVALFRGGAGVGYFDSTAAGLKYIFFDGSWWSAPTLVDEQAPGLASPSLLYASGAPVLAYYTAANGGSIRYCRAASAIGTSWEPAKDLVTGGVLPGCVMRLINGKPALVFVTTDQRLRYLPALDGQGAGWGSIVTIATLIDVPINQSIDLALVDGHPAAVFQKNGRPQFARATDPEGSAWSAPAVVNPAAANFAGLNSLAVVGGRPAVAHVVDGQVSFVRAQDAEGSQWPDSSIVDKTVQTFDSLRLVEAGGRPAVAYHGQTSRRPQFSIADSEAGQGWSAPAYLDPSDATGGYLSLAATGDQLAASYFEEVTGALRVTRSLNRGTSWSAPEVPEGGGVGKHVSAVLVNGLPGVVYYDENARDLKYVRARQVSGKLEWSASDIRTIDSGGDVGTFAALAMGGDGFPCVAYYDASGKRLKFARASETNGLSWGVPVVIDAQADAGRHLSMAIVAGHPAIIYQRTLPNNFSNNSLCYVRAHNAAGTSWPAPLTIRSGARTAEFTSLAVIGGRPAAVYSYSGVKLHFTRADDSAGASWGSPYELESHWSPGLGDCVLREINSLPTVCYVRKREKTTANQSTEVWLELACRTALNAEATAWMEAVMLAENSKGFLALESLNRSPVVTYFSDAGLRCISPVASEVSWFAVEP